jgi:hypothetical protein
MMEAINDIDYDYTPEFLSLLSLLVYASLLWMTLRPFYQTFQQILYYGHLLRVNEDVNPQGDIE